MAPSINRISWRPRTHCRRPCTRTTCSRQRRGISRRRLRSAGNKTIALYDPFQVRGFNPQDEGNVRISGLYFDQQGTLSARVIEGSAIRVGMSAVGYAFPAPTGIVDYDLRHAGDTPTLTVLVGGGPFDTRAIDLDGQVPIASLNLKIPIGISDRITDDFSGYSVHTVSAAIAPQWTPRAGLAVRMFYDWQRNSRDLIVLEIHLAGAALPPHSPSSYWGQRWAAGETEVQKKWSFSADCFARCTMYSAVIRTCTMKPRATG